MPLDFLSADSTFFYLGLYVNYMGISNQGQFDEKTLRYISENAEVEHTLLTPFRWLIGAGKAVIYAMLFLGWFTFTLVGWVVNVGEYSLENRREAVCDGRAYLHLCNQNEFDLTNPHRDYELNLGRVLNDGQGDHADTRTLDDSTYANAIAHGASFSSSGSPFDEENAGGAKPWFSFDATNGFFDRSDDVFRRKSVQMDAALLVGYGACDSLVKAIAETKSVPGTQVHLPDAPVLIVREGVMPANAIGNQAPVTWGMCLEQECSANNADLPYALYWGDVLWTRPELGEHQQHAVNALRRMGTLDFWLQEARANGIQDDKAIQDAFSEFRENSPKFGSGE